MQIGKSGCIELNETHYCTEKFNVALSLYGVLGITLYFSKGFLEAAARGSVVAEALQPLGVTVVYFLEQESNLWFSILQQRHRLFLRHFLHSLLVNLLLLASLEKRSTCGEFGCFLGVGNRDSLEKDNLADKAARDIFALLWKAMALLVVEAFPCFQK